MIVVGTAGGTGANALVWDITGPYNVTGTAVHVWDNVRLHETGGPNCLSQPSPLAVYSGTHQSALDPPQLWLWSCCIAVERCLSDGSEQVFGVGPNDHAATLQC